MNKVLFTQVASHDREYHVQDGAYLRSQAKLYFELAQLMSLRADADMFRRSAEDYLARANKVETESLASPLPQTTS